MILCLTSGNLGSSSKNQDESKALSNVEVKNCENPLEFQDPSGLWIIDQSSPNLMSDKEYNKVRLGYGKESDTINLYGCTLFATAHSVSAASGTYVNPSTLNIDRSFFEPNSSETSRQRIFDYAQSKGLTPDYWTRAVQGDLSKKIVGFSKDTGKGYSIEAEISINFGKGPESHWVGINGIHYFNGKAWGMVAPSSGHDLQKEDRLGPTWKVVTEENGAKTSYIDLSAVKEIYDFTKAPSLPESQKVDAVTSASPVEKQNPIVSFFTGMFGGGK